MAKAHKKPDFSKRSLEYRRPDNEFTFAQIQAHRKKAYHPRVIPNGWQIGKHGIGTCNEYTALLFAFKYAETPVAKEYLFWKLADMLWNSDGEYMFVRNKWSVKLIRAACNEKYLAIGGSASSGKSYIFAGWGIINWLADPANTLVLFTSTDLKGARRRVWGAMRKLLQKVPDPPCKIRDAVGVIAYYDGKDALETSGIQMVTADKSSSANKVGKLVGMKAPRVILIADELGEMGPNVQSAATGNLAKNPYFQMVGLSNPASRFDPFGAFATPANGWTSVDVLRDTEWRTSLNGLYIRLDSADSPNINPAPCGDWEIHDSIPGIITQEMIDADLYLPGVTPEDVRKTRNFMRFHSAVFFDGDEAETVYSESELVRAGALDHVKIHNPTVVAGVDVSYSDGGDQTVMVVGEEGYDRYGQQVIQVRCLEYITEDMTDLVNPRTLQVADKIKALCKKHDIKPENLGIDASSGSGVGICDMLRLQMDTNLFLRVQFGGAASDRPIKNDSKITGKQRYKNRATELFMQGKMFLMGKQFFGIPGVIAKQICQRVCLEPTKGEKGLMYQIERKKDFKARTGYSPDEADAYFVMVETAMRRRMFTAQDPVAQNEDHNIATWLQTKRTHEGYAADKMGFVANL